MTAGRAAVVAEMADVRGRILVRGTAADAPLRVGRVLQLRRGVPGVVEAENDRTGPFRSDRRRAGGRRRWPRASRRKGAHRPSRASAGPPARAPRNGRAGLGTGSRARPRAARRASTPPAGPPRPPRTAPARRRGRPRAPRPRRRRGSRRHGCAPAAPRAPGSARPSRPWSSCRSSPRRAPSPLEAVQPAGRRRLDPASRAAFRAASCRRPRRPGARARLRRGRARSRGPAGRARRHATATGGDSPIRGNFRQPHPGGGCSETRAKPRFRPDFAAGDQRSRRVFGRHAARAKARKGDTEGEERRNS